MALIGWMFGLVGPSWHICMSYYGENTIIGRAMAIPALPEPTPMQYAESSIIVYHLYFEFFQYSIVINHL